MKTKSVDIKKILKSNVMEVVLLIITIIIAFTATGFFTSSNLLGILRSSALKGVIAFGMTMVIICGEIDLSISSTVALSGIITALTAGKLESLGIMPLAYGVIVGMILALAAAALIGVFNGFLRTRFNIPTFIITLAMMNVLYGAAALLSKGFPLTSLPAWYNVLGAGSIGPVPVPAIILIVIFIVVHIIMSYTTFGRAVYAVGGNPESARLSGINVKKVKILVMVGVQVLAALGGIMCSSQVMSAAHNFGKGWEMDVIASVIIGGASMNGGIGKVRGTFVGIIFLGILLNGMTLMNVSEYVQYIVRGGLILGAVLVNAIQFNRSGDV